MQVPRDVTNDDGTIPVELRGTEEAIEKARLMIEELLKPPDNYQPPIALSGAPFNYKFLPFQFKTHSLTNKVYTKLYQFHD